MAGIIVDVREYVLKISEHIKGHNLNPFDQRLVATTLMESAFYPERKERELYHLVEIGVASPGASYLYSILRGRHEIQLLQYDLYNTLTDIAWMDFRNKALSYTVSVESGKVLISARPRCPINSPYLPQDP